MTLKPPLKWAGGKRWLLPYLQPIWEKHTDRRLVELFCGGLSVTLGLNPKTALLNDINPHLINFYQWLQHGLTITFDEKDHDKDEFYRHRTRFNDLIKQELHETEESAALFYYLNRTCFNGLCRFNRQGLFNVPFGRYSRINYMTTDDFRAYQSVLRMWMFTNNDFASVPLQDDDFVYADPPYDVEFTSYAKEDFTWSDQIRLVEFLSTHTGPVMISNQATERIVNLYEQYGYTLQFLDAPRRISSSGDRTPAREVVALRNIDTTYAQPISKPEQMKLL